METLASSLQHESNQRRIKSFIKQHDLLADAQLDNAAIYGSFNNEYSIYHEFDSDLYKIKNKKTLEYLTEDETSIWLKAIDNPRAAIAVKSDHKINSLNFNNPLNINGKGIINVDRLWEINEDRKTDIMNACIQQYYGIFDESDEAAIFLIELVTAQYMAMQHVLRHNKIKVLDRSRKENNESYVKEQINKENGLNKKGKSVAKPSKTGSKLMIKMGDGSMYDMGNDPLYNKYKHDDLLIKMFRNMKFKLSDPAAHAWYAKSKTL